VKGQKNKRGVNPINCTDEGGKGEEFTTPGLKNGESILSSGRHTNSV